MVCIIDNSFVLADVIYKRSEHQKSTTHFEGFVELSALYTRYPIVARALGLAAAFRPSARASKGILHTTKCIAAVFGKIWR